ncbi:MAG: hypothetical protein HQM12_07755 [SAR324 cluster bacterium]|nr:hypothetical protein [SAR324 cluster bacterium]MBF0351467.1 hypothetical protein [SAR324 cluster bacterium]
MGDEELMKYCKEKIIEYAREALAYFKEVKIFSPSNAIEMMIISDEMQKDSSLSWKIGSVDANKDGSFFIISR